MNGKTALLGQKADPEVDEITVDGRPLTQEGQKRYLMLNKPRGYVCTLSDEKGRKTVAELVRDCGARVYPVGRLDLDSEGLLLLTNDGEWMQHLPVSYTHLRAVQEHALKLGALPVGVWRDLTEQELHATKSK